MKCSAASSSQLSSNTGNPSSSDPNLLYKMKITLFDYHCGDKDGRWRRVIVPENFSLYGLHIVIQEIFGWEGYHLLISSPRTPTARTSNMALKKMAKPDQSTNL